MYTNPSWGVCEQLLVIIDAESGQQICTARVGPTSLISVLKDGISQSTGIPAREIMLRGEREHKFKNSDCIGAEIFKKEIPKLHLKRLGPEEANREESRDKAFAQILGGTKLSLLEDEAQADPDIVLFAVQSTSPAELQHAAQEVKRDAATMIEALKISTLCMYYVAPELWSDRAFMISATHIDGLLLGASMVPKAWCSDHEVVLRACENHGYALQFASDELKNDRSVVSAAVNQRGASLMYASQEMQSDHHIVLNAIRNNRMAIVHAKGGLRDDEEIRRNAGQSPSRRQVDRDKNDRIKAKFLELDVNGDGYLSYEQLAQFLRACNQNMTDDEQRLLFDASGTHEDGKVDYNCFSGVIGLMDAPPFTN